MTVRVGDAEVPLSRFQAMEEGADALIASGKWEEVRARIARDGYVLVRNAVAREIVLAARRVVVETLASDWGYIDAPPSDARFDSAPILRKAGSAATERDASDSSALKPPLDPRARNVILTGYRTVTHHPNVLALLEGAPIVSLMRNLYGGRTPATFDNKWVRVMARDEYTDEHTDYYRFAGSADGMHTCWLPLGDYSPREGTLAVCCGSHLLPDLTTTQYDVESKLELPPSYESFARTAVWRSASFRAGDAVIFDIRTVHASTVNESSNFRISMDTRWRPAGSLDDGLLRAGCFTAFPTVAADPGEPSALVSSAPLSSCDVHVNTTPCSDSSTVSV